MTACDPEEPAPQPYTQTIATAEDFKALSEKQGEASSYGTFTLTNDIDLGAEYMPSGVGVDTSFRGVFDGQGHKITYTITQQATAPTSDEEQLTAQATRYWGLFGYLYNATVKNLTVEVNIDVDADSEVTYIGGLAAFAYGSVKLENVTVNGDIELGYGYLPPYNATLGTGYKLTAFTGGAIGYAEGKDIALSGVKTDVNISVAGRSMLNDRGTLDDVYAGGIAGLIRTENNTSTGTTYITASDVVAGGDLNVNAAAVTVGGLYGLAQRTNVSGALFTGKVAVYGSGKVVAGGIAGVHDRGTIATAAVSGSADVSTTAPAVRLDVGRLGGESNKYLASVGGIAGYVSFGTVTDSVAVTDIAMLAYGQNNYSGGIVGQLYNGTLLNVAAMGSCDTLFSMNSPSNQKDSHGQYAAAGGIAGRIYGRSSFDKVYSGMSGVYQGIAGEIVDGVETVTLEEGQTVQGLFPGYVAFNAANAATAAGTYQAIGEEGENKYMVTHRTSQGTALFTSATVETVNKTLYYDYYAENGLSTPGEKVVGVETEFDGIVNKINE